MSAEAGRFKQESKGVTKIVDHIGAWFVDGRCRIGLKF